MSKSYRIRTTPGEDNGYLKVNVDLNQNYDHLEILSLKISQNDDYKNFCAEYGVLAGRVIINNGFGVPNVKVSIFVPVEPSDLDNPIISQIYPYSEPFSDQKNGQGIRYNLLPKNQQSLDHTPVGTFPKKREILDNNTTLEIFEKYYKYTTTTNESGDYILFGLPLGDHILHYDMDVSDIGYLSLRPFDLISQGYPNNLFKDRFKFKSSNNLDSLPQIFSDNIPVTIEPYWCDSLSVGSPLGINRLDISIDNIEITPTSIFMGSVFTDDEKDSLNKNCKPAKEMGKLNEVITSSGKIEAIRRTTDGSIETFSFNDGDIDNNGNWSVLVPMNLRKVVTDEFGNLVPSPDGIKGVATEGDYRFRISIDSTSTDKRLRQRAKFLVPNTNNNFNFDKYSSEDLKKTKPFKINSQLSTITTGTPYQNDITNQYNYLEEFYPFRWKKVYTVKQYIGRIQKIGGDNADEARGFIGIKDIINATGVNKFPTNRIDTSFNPIYTLLCVLLTYFGLVVGLINGILNIINGLVTSICNIKIPIGISLVSNKGSQLRPQIQTQGWDTSDSCWKRLNDNGNTTGNCGEIRSNNDSDLGGLLANNENPLSNCADVSNRVTPPDADQIGKCGLINYEDLHSTQKGSTWYLTPIVNFFELLGGSGSAIYQEPGQTENRDWYYNYASCYTSPSAGCKRIRVGDGSNWYGGFSDCDSCGIDKPCDDGCIRISNTCVCFKFTCLFSPLLCKRCEDFCGEGERHSCCPNNYEYGCEVNETFTGNVGKCCKKCCVKIPLISLKCQEEDKDIRISLLPTPFAASSCNQPYVEAFTCKNCGGFSTPGIKDWVSCTLEPVAVYLRMLKFDFYNDWVGGTLYFPLIKRKYVLKKSKRRFGQVKKDKFCDFDCKIKNSDSFQGQPYFLKHRIKIGTILFSNPKVTYEGCTAKIKGKKVSEWYGCPNCTEVQNKENAVKDIVFPGLLSNGDGCNIRFDSFANFETFLNSESINFNVQDKKVSSEHDKPEYIEVEDANGTSSWENIGGHGHHRNICNDTRVVERKEFFKISLDCKSNTSLTDIEIATEISGDIGIPKNTSDEDGSVITNGSGCGTYGCSPDCGSNGVAPCVTKDIKTEYDNYKADVKHGLVSWYNGEIYYTPYIPNDDLKYNKNEYKANLFLPTTIMELGSISYCDVDDVPFIMDQLEPTTFNASYEDIKYKYGTSTPNYNGENGVGVLKTFKKYDDKKDISLNLRSYVEFGCSKVICSNTLAVVNQSQLGVEIIDKNDIGVTIGNCFVRFEHDSDLRGYFCKKFNGFKGEDLSFHHNRPGSSQFDNIYQTYPEIKLSEGSNIYQELPDGGGIFLSEYNDSDSFIPGDACGYYRENQSPNYFYGLAPGVTSGFINYPNLPNETINFGQQQSPIVDNINDDLNGNVNVKGIRFNRSQTPYYLYFGLVPGKTALHKVVNNFFADKINSVTLIGVPGTTNNKAVSNNNNTPNVNEEEVNNFTVFKTCLGETLIPNVEGQ